ncbi:MAG TPA: TIGR03013 family XrtA/PEP-CTERM system glycosyltransferase, partial [Terriglobales bacterium]
SVITLLCSYFCDLYAPEEHTRRDEIYYRIITVVGVLALVLATLTYVFPVLLVGNSVFPVGLIVLTAGLLSWRRAYYWLLRQSVLRERVYVLGCDDHARWLAKKLRTSDDMGVEVVDWQDTMSPAPSREELAKRIRRLKDRDVQRIIVAVSDRRGMLPVEELLDLRFRGIKVEDATALFEKHSGKIEIDGLFPSWLIFAEGFRSSQFYNALRVTGSTVMSLLLLLLVLPLLPFIVVAIKLSSPGPVLYRQARVGKNGTVFHCYKFRTMWADAEADTGPTWARDDDPRITPVGNYLRMLRLDEIPQLWNILRGDMLFVGPRPERPEFVEQLAAQIPYYRLRHMVRPGLTGWAQVRYKYGSSVHDAKEKLKYDLFYIKNMSLGLDVVIFLKTLKVVLFGNPHKPVHASGDGPDSARPPWPAAGQPRETRPAPVIPVSVSLAGAEKISSTPVLHPSPNPVSNLQIPAP